MVQVAPVQTELSQHPPTEYLIHPPTGFCPTPYSCRTKRKGRTCKISTIGHTLSTIGHKGPCNHHVDPSFELISVETTSTALSNSACFTNAVSRATCTQLSGVWLMRLGQPTVCFDQAAITQFRHTGPVTAFSSVLSTRMKKERRICNMDASGKCCFLKGPHPE